jgi:hypothetical protein
MAQTHEYFVIMGSVRDTNDHLSKMAPENWKPTSLSATVNSNSPVSQVQVIILLERPITPKE